MDRDLAIFLPPNGAQPIARKQTWHYPSRAECMVCHSRAANFVLGPSTLQMNRDHTYPNGQTDNQLRVLEHIGLIPAGTMHHAETGKRLVDPYDAKQDLEARVRSYLHANCAHCHVEAGGGNASIDLEFTTARDKMRLLAEPARHQTFDLRNAALVVPGHPEESVLVHRMGIRGPGQMPPLASSRVDERAVGLLRGWVRQLR